MKESNTRYSFNKPHVFLRPWEDRYDIGLMEIVELHQRRGAIGCSVKSSPYEKAIREKLDQISGQFSSVHCTAVRTNSVIEKSYFLGRNPQAFIREALGAQAIGRCFPSFSPSQTSSQVKDGGQPEKPVHSWHFYFDPRRPLPSADVMELDFLLIHEGLPAEYRASLGFLQGRHGDAGRRCSSGLHGSPCALYTMLALRAVHFPPRG